MSDFELQKIIERLAAKIANDLKQADAANTVASVTMRDAPAACTELAFEPVNPLEQTSLKALISWASANCNISEQQIETQLIESFHAETVAGISHADFDEAVAWLVDFRPILN